MMFTFCLSELRKIWPVSVPLLVSVQQGKHITCTHHAPFNIIFFITCRKSASCTHISALLHALAAITPVPFPVASSSVADDEDADCVPITSLPCQWKPPRKRKESNQKMSDATFEKHVYGQTKKVKLLPIEDYDPRPEKYRNKVDTHMKKFLDVVRGKGLVVSLLLDPSTRYWGDNTQPVLLPPELPSIEQLEQTIIEFKKSLNATMQQAREIEGKTRSQRHSPEWFAARRYRITASVFGLIHRRKPDTPPDALVANLLEQRQVTSQYVQLDSTSLSAIPFLVLLQMVVFMIRQILVSPMDLQK